MRSGVDTSEKDQVTTAATLLLAPPERERTEPIMDTDKTIAAVCVEPNCPTCSPAVVGQSTWHLDEVDRVLYGPSIDVCAWCTDSECDGIACIAALDPDDESEHPAIEQLHAWIRRGRFAEQVERVLAQCENRPVPPKWGA